LSILRETVDFFEKGGPMMIPLLASSIVALAVTLERLIQLKHKRVLDPHLVNMVNNIHTIKDVEMLNSICHNSNSSLANVIRTGLENRHLPPSELKELFEDSGRQETRNLERGLGALETVAVSSPLMGLLGTVLGMLKVFNVISEIGVGQASALSAGISQALITTIFGLSIGIPALIAYNYFTHKVEDLVADIEKCSIVLFHKLRSMNTANQ